MVVDCLLMWCTVHLLWRATYKINIYVSIFVEAVGVGFNKH